MEIEPDILKRRADGIGATTGRDSSAFFYRGYTPLNEEIRMAIDSKTPRFGNSPRYASVQVTLNCNLDCSGCNVKQMRETRRGQQMTTEDILLVLDRLRETNVQWVDFTGGDPLVMKQDLVRIVAHSRKLGMCPTLNTNGLIPKGDMERKLFWRDLAEAGLKAAIISYEGTGQKTDAEAIGLAGFLHEPLHIYSAIRTVVTQDNLDKVYNIGEMCMNNSIFFEAVPAVALGGQISASPNENFHPLDAQGRKEYINIIRALKKVRGPFAKFLRTEEAYLREVVMPDAEWHCAEPARYLIFVNAYGELQVCNDRLLKEETHSLLGDHNPLFDKKFYQAVKMQAKECGGCRWLCNWRSQRRQAMELSHAITASSFT